MTSIPAIVIEGLTAAKMRALMLADNRIAQSAGWDRERLAIELAALPEVLIEDGLERLLDLNRLRSIFSRPTLKRIQEIQSTNSMSAASRGLSSVGMGIYGGWAVIACCAAMPAMTLTLITWLVRTAHTWRFLIRLIT